MAKPEEKFIFLSANFVPESTPQDMQNIKEAVIWFVDLILARGIKLVAKYNPGLFSSIIPNAKDFINSLAGGKYNIDYINSFAPGDRYNIINLYANDYLKSNFSLGDKKYIKKNIVKIIQASNNDEAVKMMLQKDRKFRAAIFIGGNEEAEKELEMFSENHPETPIYPIGTTGGAAKKLLEEKIIRPLKEGKWRFKWKYEPYLRDKLNINIPYELETSVGYGVLINKILIDIAWH